MIDAYQYRPDEVKRAYDHRSNLYAMIVSPRERGYHQVALEAAQIQPDEKILEVAIGPGHTLVEILKRVTSNNVVYGVDISQQMVELAGQYARDAGYTNFELSRASADDLKYEDNTFDIVYNAYMLDLIPFAEMRDILDEFRRVLKPGGRLILLNMSRRDTSKKSWRDRMYQFFPRKVVLYLAGGCRPVLMEGPVWSAGFSDVSRRYVGGKAPSEVIVAYNTMA